MFLSSVAPKRNVRLWLSERWEATRSFFKRAWTRLRPGPEARKGLVWATLTTVVWAAVIGAWNLKSGFGFGVDLLFAVCIAAIGIPITTLLLAFVLTILRHLPRLVSGFFIAAVIYVSLLWIPPLGQVTGFLVVAVEAALGASIATMLVGDFRNMALIKRVLTIVICVAAIAANASFFVFFRRDGINEELIRIQQATRGELPPKLNAANPAERGPFAVKTLFYGSGNDLRRPEYGKQVAIRTGFVDASSFFKDFSGWKAYLRERYWGFGMDRLPLNGRVWYPDGAGPFPLVLIVHGNHNMAEFSDPGYGYLGELLASRGFILASIDENFLNSGLFHDPPKQQAVRGWMLLEHLSLWRKWNRTTANPFYGKVDVENVALMGHSRGGEAAATAALFNKLAYYPDDATIHFNYGFPIKSIVAIAPADGQYKPAGEWRVLQDVNYFTLQGAHDADVSSFSGSRQWDHVRFTGAGSFFKTELYIYRANHGQFNTVWGRTDIGAPNNWFLNLHPLLSGEDQRRIAKVYISAFLEATLHNRREYKRLFQDHRRIRDWLPNTLYVSRYLDSTNRIVSDFTEDTDVTTTTVAGGRLAGDGLTVWREGRIPYRQGDRDYNGVFLGWNSVSAKKRSDPPTPVYAITLPENLARDWKLDRQSVITLSMAVTDEKAPLPGKKAKDEAEENEKESKQKPETTDFSVELETAAGISARLPLSKFRALLPPFKVQFTKLAFLDKFAYQKASEPIFQTIELPLDAFVQNDGRFDPAKLKTIRLRFDRTPTRVVILSEIGFERAI
ncbi:MAG: hypothetical protein JOY62_05660 [Acidobacteriaceae bacterium]|nr:hypothetical protein [Acidobacteriaceae bacterium]MBV9779444.1 hypothetical protein [Acidobacteriaceae bacterium]